MATLVTSLAIQSCRLNRGGSRSSKTKHFSRIVCINRIINRFDKMDERKLFCGEVARQIARTYPRNLNVEVYARSQVSVEPVEQRFSANTQVEDPDKVSSYLFRTEIGGLVNVSVRKRNVNYAVYVEISSLPLSGNDDRLVLNWGMYRDDSSSFTSVDTPFSKISFGRFSIQLDFEAKGIPVYLSFLFKSLVDANSSGLQIRSHRKTNFVVPVGFDSGHPSPLGLSFSSDGSMNFAIFSRNAESVVLCLYDDTTVDDPALELDLDPYVNRSGDIWHASFESAWNFVSYGYRFKGTHLQKNKDSLDGHILLDPYAKIIGNSTSSKHGNGLKYLGQLCKEPDFDWNDDIHPNLPLEKLVVYRLNTKRFTEHKSSGLPSDIAGTFSGLIEKLEHLKDLGVNAVLLEPVFPFDETKGPYFPCHFFSPTNLYGPSGGPVSAINSMKDMVKKLHANGIEVLLEVVFTHTADNESLHGIDDESYYYANGAVDLVHKSALNSNYPIVQQMILDSLRHWVTEFHIDGFCFINASYLLRGFYGEKLSRPPLVEAIAFDPLLSNTKNIADCWDPHDMVPKETRFPHWKRWAEMNAKFCYDVRNFLRGEGLLSDLATRLCGSGDIFSGGRGPAYSFNFIARNSGLPLVDLVSFSGDELASELSWNCGEEGPTNKTAVLERRLKQIRNFLFVLHVSLGVPVLNMGDECGQSSSASPSYDDRKSFDWKALRTGFGIQTTQFISFLNSLRTQRCDLLQKRNFLKEENIDWYGSDQSLPRWEDPSCKFLAMRLKVDEDKLGNKLTSELSSDQKGDLFIAFNAAHHKESVILPPPPKGMEWHRLVDTALPFPGFFSTDGEPVVEHTVGLVAAYEMKSHSCTLFEARSK
ncbi:isoamylase 2, chloroplastic [Ziziphus jujuba]|uniref:Isoamylase 2, chloroplastic n=2 Tax=Ziziphus jujuba TaxID=326968 RepID=A0AC41ZC90_ZIZJJ|nr:isoamylase 2, chloroplastic [Ziziphus jujuba]